MFTGLIEELGTIQKIENIGDGRKFTVSADLIFSDLKVDDSVSTNGCCLTVISVSEKTYSCIAIEETLSKTTLGGFVEGQKINLERSVLPTTRMGGHFVQGHVDCVGLIVKSETLSTSWTFTIEFPKEFEKYIIKIGAISVDGTSLTVADLDKNRFKVAIIPHTMEKTIFPSYKVGTKVNLEFDLLGKYIEKIFGKSLNQSPI